MEDRLAREEQISEDVRTTQETAVDSFDQTVLSPEVKALIERCMDGTEPAGDIAAYHVKKFNPSHIQAVMLRIAGFRPPEIARTLGMDAQAIYKLMIHPYSKKIFKALAPAQYGRVIDIRTRMEEQASMLMDHAFALAMVSEDIKEVKDVTFGFLDRAGYNVVNKAVSANGTPKDFGASGPELSRIANALDESALVNSVVMPNWTAPRPPEDSSVTPDFFVVDPVPVVEGAGGGPAASLPAKEA